MKPLPASTVMAVHDADGELEVLMVRRVDAGPFAGLFVFPGGKVDASDAGSRAAEAITELDDPDERTWRAAGLRELAEETGLVVTEQEIGEFSPEGHHVYDTLIEMDARHDVRRLVYVSNWVTPMGVPYRFDTRFYLLRLDRAYPVVPRRGEVVEAHWVRPAVALDRLAEGRWPMTLPTVSHLELLSSHPTVDRLLEHLPHPDQMSSVDPPPVSEEIAAAIRARDGRPA